MQLRFHGHLKTSIQESEIMIFCDINLPNEAFLEELECCQLASLLKEETTQEQAEKPRNKPGTSATTEEQAEQPNNKPEQDLT